ncbi:hypothetical protein ACFYUH_34820 [Streptomyces fimicarius]|uniref:hypothetical protein n=1 Tax=Streptomyces griseus TaxID=1911 RepID=UPI0036A3E052
MDGAFDRMLRAAKAEAAGEIEWLVSVDSTIVGPTRMRWGTKRRLRGVRAFRGRRCPSPARIATGVLVILFVGGGFFGLRGIIGVPVTHVCIHDHGVDTEARLDGEWVRFTAADGTDTL